MKSTVENLSISDFTYELPSEKIAVTPATQRGASKLLVYDHGNISETVFHQLPSVIDPDSALVFNTTKVVQARIIFQNRNGRDIEIFCLEPAGAHTEMTQAMAATATTQWLCMVGGVKKWKEPYLTIANTEGFELRAHLTERLNGVFVVTFDWQPAELTFSEVLEQVGKIPLPPYIKREVKETDKTRYQTVFAKEEGSVAAPTAGLHFTEDILSDLHRNGIDQHHITLHVGAGTFKPVSADKMKDHPMHAEWISAHIDTLETLAHTPKRITPVGTTSMRTLESLYWLGVKLLHENTSHIAQELLQWDAYELPQDVPVKDALLALVDNLRTHNLTQIMAKSRLIIAPGYTPKLCGALITNFHQPNSTLLLLVAALIGDDWKKVYAYALANDFKFLSYGDSNYLRF